MDGLMTFMNRKVVPFTNKVTRNPWVKSVQDSFMTILPFILLGSFITLISLVTEIPWVQENWAWWPDMSPINSFTFGLMGLIMAFLIPYFIMENKGVQRTKLLAGATGIAMFLILAAPNFDDEGNIILIFERLGATGMFGALVVGLFVGFVMYRFASFSFFKNSSSMPDFIITWFDSLIPISISVVIAWLINFVFGWDAFNFLAWIFGPLVNIGQSYAGFVILVFLIVFIYTFGISSWVLGPIMFPIMLTGIQTNMDLVAAGQPPTAINTMEVIYTGWIAIGGLGATLPLAIMMTWMSRSQQLRAIGKAVIVPSVFNINEPVYFGAPIAFNPILMIPTWINGLLLPLIVWPVLHFGLAPIPSQIFQLWYLPFPISTWMVAPGIAGLLLFLVCFVLAALVFFPFFKVYDNQLLRREAESAEQLPV